MSERHSEIISCPLRDLSKASKETLTALKREIEMELCIRRWREEGEELKKIYPEFDLYATVNEDEGFCKLLGLGFDVKTAYETARQERRSARNKGLCAN